MAEVLRLLQPDHGSPGVVDVTADGAAALGVDGVAVSLVTEAGPTELLWCSDEATRRFEDLQLTLGEGPGPDAARTGAMVWVPDLARVRPARWPALAMEAPDLEARAVFCFPMGIGAIRVGVLTAVRRTPGPLTPQQADDALILASALTARCLGTEPAAVRTLHGTRRRRSCRHPPCRPARHPAHQETKATRREWLPQAGAGAVSGG